MLYYAEEPPQILSGHKMHMDNIYIYISNLPCATSYPTKGAGRNL